MADHLWFTKGPAPFFSLPPLPLNTRTWAHTRAHTHTLTCFVDLPTTAGAGPQHSARLLMAPRTPQNEKPMTDPKAGTLPGVGRGGNEWWGESDVLSKPRLFFSPGRDLQGNAQVMCFACLVHAGCCDKKKKQNELQGDLQTTSIYMSQFWGLGDPGPWQRQAQCLAGPAPSQWVSLDYNFRASKGLASSCGLCCKGTNPFPRAPPSCLSTTRRPPLLKL